MFFQRCSHSKVQFFIVLFYFFAMQADPQQSSTSSISGSGKTSQIVGNIESYQVEDTIFQGKKCTHFMYVDKQTRTITGSCMIPHDGSTPMMTSNFKPIAIQDTNIIHLQALSHQHESFRNQSRVTANQRDFKFQISMAYLKNQISAADAYARETQVYQEQLTFKLQKTVKERVKKAKKQIKINKNLKKLTSQDFRR